MLSAALSACKNDVPGADVFLVAGQSNGYYGEAVTGETLPDGTLDASDTQIKQVGRFDGEDNTIIAATEPLDHIGQSGSRPPSDVVGFALTFAKMYIYNKQIHPSRTVLLVPVCEGGSGFSNNKWNPGDANYLDAVARVYVALGSGTGVNRFKGILWHQGEADSTTTNNANAHKAALLAMIDAFRSEFNDSTLPFVAGGMVPAILDSNGDIVQAGIADIVNQRSYTGYANPSSPTELTASPIGSNQHFSARSMRGYPTQDFSDYTSLGMAGRYWVAYRAALTNV